MNKLYMGIDTGLSTVKGIIIDEYNNILASGIEKNLISPIDTTKKLIKELLNKIDLKKYQISSVGVTGSKRKLIGILLNTNIIKNEIVSETTGVISIYPKIKTILSLGNQSSKIINVDSYHITNYSINSMSLSEELLSNINKILGIKEDEIDNIINSSQEKIDMSEECPIFIGELIEEKIRNGYKKEDILKSIYENITDKYIEELKYMVKGPVILIGGVTKNKALIKMLETKLNTKIIINKNSELMGAYGIAIITKNSKKEITFEYDIDSLNLEIEESSCQKCQKNCQILNIYKNKVLVSSLGANCNN